MTTDQNILIGNTFPMTLVRRHQVVVEEIAPSEIVREAKARHVKSFWGHENTRVAAEAVLGVGLKPATPRPALTLDAAGHPTLDGDCFTECYVLSPDYRAGYRPATGVEVPPSDIAGWHALKLTWLN